MSEAFLEKDSLLKRHERRIIVRRIGRFLRRAHFLLLGRRRYGRLTIEEVVGKTLLVLPGVFNPVLFRSGAFMAQFLDSNPLPAGSRVLDLGTGTGVGAVVSADRAQSVIAVDVNPEAVRCAQINVLLNELEKKIEVREADLFSSFQGEKFDVVLFNPPYLRGDASSAFERAFWSRDVVEKFARQLDEHLTDRGFGIVVFSSDGPLADYLETFSNCDLSWEPLAETDLISEVLVILKLTPLKRP